MLIIAIITLWQDSNRPSSSSNIALPPLNVYGGSNQVVVGDNNTLESNVLNTSTVQSRQTTIDTDSFIGSWLTNVATFTVSLRGSQIVAHVDGYGGHWNETFRVSIKNRRLIFDETFLMGITTIALSNDGFSFTSLDPQTSFCGVRVEPVPPPPLPVGCGFSGHWNLSGSEFPVGSHVILTQQVNYVRGTIYEHNSSDIFDNIFGRVYWGKGWMMNGVRTYNLNKFTLMMSGPENEFSVFFDGANSYNGQKGVRITE